MNKPFFASYGHAVHQKIVGMGTTFTDMEERPERLFTENGYATVDIASVALYAADRGSFGIPAFAIRYFLTTLRDGYTIAVFRR
jgi:hypothetical protein